MDLADVDAGTESDHGSSEHEPFDCFCHVECGVGKDVSRVVAPLAGRDITVQWMAISRTDSSDAVSAAAGRIAGAFTAASERGERSPERFNPTIAG